MTIVSLNNTLVKKHVVTTASTENPKDRESQPHSQNNINETLFENASNKVTEINERSIILIDSKHKINHKNIQSGKQQIFTNDYVKNNNNNNERSYKYNDYKTFIANDNPVETELFDVIPQTLDFTDKAGMIISDIGKRPLLNGYPGYYTLRKNNSIYNELRKLEQKVKAANSIIGHQYRQMKKQSTLAQIKAKQNDRLLSERREYVELMKPPLLRPTNKLQASQIESNKSINYKNKLTKSVQEHNNYIISHTVTNQRPSHIIKSCNKLQDTGSLNNFDTNKKDTFQHNYINNDVNTNKYQNKYNILNPSTNKFYERNKIKNPFIYQNRNHFHDTDDFVIFEQQSAFDEINCNTIQRNNVDEDFKKALHHRIDDNTIQLKDFNDKFSFKQIALDNNQFNKNMQRIESKSEDNVHQTKLYNNHIPVRNYKPPSANVLHQSDTNYNNQIHKNSPHSEKNDNNIEHQENLGNNYQINEFAEKLEEMTLDTELHTNEGLSISTDSDNIKTDRYVYTKKVPFQKIPDIQEKESKLLENCLYPDCVTSSNLNNSFNLSKSDAQEIHVSISKSGEIPAIPAMLLNANMNSEDNEISY